MKKILTLLFLVLLCVGGWADDWMVSLPEHSVVSVSETAESAFEVSTSADDNSHWYVLQQRRADYIQGGKLTPVVDTGDSQTINRTSGNVSSVITNGITHTSNALQYLVRLIPGDYSGSYKIQFATGRYFAPNGSDFSHRSTLKSSNYSSALNFLVYKINDTDGHIGINSTTDGTTFGWILDNNGPGGTLAFWESGKVTSLDGNNDWKVYKATITEVEHVAVNYTLQIDGNTIAQPTITEYVGFAPSITVPSDIVEYLDGSEQLPAQITKDKTSYTINTKYKDNFTLSVDGTKEYTLKCRGNLYAYASSADATIISLTTNAPTYLLQGNYRWTINGNWYTGFKLTNKLAAKHIAGPAAVPGDGAFAKLTTDDTNNCYDIKVIGNKWAFLQHGTTKSYLSNHGGAKVEELKYYSEVDDGSQFAIEEAVDIAPQTISYTVKDENGTTYTGSFQGSINLETNGDVPPFTGVSNVSYDNPKWNKDNLTLTADIRFPFTLEPTYITGEPNGRLCYFYAKGDAVKTRVYSEAGSLPTNQPGENDKWKWQIVPFFKDNAFSFSIKNLSENKYIVTSSATLANLTLGEEANATKYSYAPTNINNGYGFCDVNNPNVFITVFSQQSGERDAMAWPNSGGHQGSNLRFHTPADFADLMLKLSAANTVAASYVIGNGTGEYSDPDGAFEADKTKAASIIAGTEYATAAQFKTYTKNLSSGVNLTINQPVAGFYYIKNKGTQTYVKGEKTDGTLTPMQADADKNAIFYIDADKNIMAYENGAYWKNVYRLGVGEFSDTSYGSLSYKHSWEFSKGNSAKQYLLRYGNENEGRYYAIGGSETTDYSVAATTDDNGSWELVPVTTLPLSIGTNGWATFSAPVAVTVPGDVQAFYVNNEPSDGKVILSEVNGAVPANQGIIVKGTDGSTVNISTEVGGAEADLSGNKLVANVEAKSISGTAGDGVYAFATNKNVTPYVTGFMKLLTTITLPGHKCYLVSTGSASSARFMPIFTEDDFTGIDGVENPSDSQAAQVYDLQGRKVYGVEKGRMYIQNGKTFIAY